MAEPTKGGANDMEVNQDKFQPAYQSDEASPKETANDIKDEDEKILHDMGYSQELLRGFDGLMNFSFCFTAVAVVSSLAGLYPTAMATGGPVEIVWSWIVVSIATILVSLSMAEICSTYPSAGSVYHWASCCASEKYAPIAAYVTGWFNFIGNAAGDAFFGYSFAAFVASAVQMQNGEILSTGVQVAIGIAVCLAWAVLNLAQVDKQGWVNNFAALFQVAVTLIIVISVIVSCVNSGHVATGDEVFFTYYNGTGFSSTPYVLLIGLLPAVYGFTGYEAAGHMAEETRGAKRTAPMGIVWTCVASAITGFIFLIGLLFGSANDVAGFVNNGSTVATIFETCGGYSLGLALDWLLVVNMFFSGFSSLTVTTRIAYAMARDGAFPGSKLLAYVMPQTKIPLGTIPLVFVVDALFISLNLVNTTAFVNVTAISTIGYQISYALAILMRVTFSRDSFPRSAIHLGSFSLIVGWFSVFFLTFTAICFLFPTTYPITAPTMNYSVVVLAGFILLGLIYWMAYARNVFTGPKRPTIVSQTGDSDDTKPSADHDSEKQRLLQSE